MSQYAKDSNYNVTPIRLGSPIGGYYTPSSPAQNTWYRLMPESNTGAKVSGDDRQLEIGTLRSDVRNADITGWHLDILTQSYLDQFFIESYDAATGRATIDASRHGGNIETHIKRLPSTYDFVLYPELILPLAINYMSSATDDIEIGYVSDDVLNPTDVVKLVTLSPGELLVLPVNRVDRVFYRFTASSPASDNAISWGEHYVRK